MTKIASASIDVLTVIAIAAIAVTTTIAFHEGMHALSCVVLGGDLLEYNALHVVCEQLSPGPEKFVAGCASIANLIVGTILWLVLRQDTNRAKMTQYIIWLFMLTNWLNGAGYWAFSGIANVGDWAKVIEGWNPAWFWRTSMTLLGLSTFMLLVWLALKEMGKLIGGDVEEEQIARNIKITLIPYFTAVVIVLLVGFFHPAGFSGLPVWAGLLAVAGGLSPLAWMGQWFRAKSFEKHPGEALEIRRNWSLIGLSLGVSLVYVIVLGRTIYF